MEISSEHLHCKTFLRARELTFWGSPPTTCHVSHVTCGTQVRPPTTFLCVYLIFVCSNNWKTKYFCRCYISCWLKWYYNWLFFFLPNYFSFFLNDFHKGKDFTKHGKNHKNQVKNVLFLSLKTKCKSFYAGAKNCPSQGPYLLFEL